MRNVMAKAQADRRHETAASVVEIGAGRSSRKAGSFLGIFALALGVANFAMSAEAQTVGGVVPDHAFFVGAGASYNYTNFGSQNVYAVGTSNNYAGGQLISSGTAAGPGDVSVSSPSSVGPNVQVGYFQHFNQSAWLWGFKFFYNDLFARGSASNAGIPQAGAYTYTESQTVVPFTGVAVVDSYRTQALNRFSLMPFVGRSFERGFVYLGIGPTITQTQTSLNGLIGYAYIDGKVTNVSGAPQNFSSSGWVLGGAVDVGATYFLTPSWFIDIDYVIAKTATQTGNYSSTFVNSTTNPGVTTEGTLVGSSSENIVTQNLMITINKAF